LAADETLLQPQGFLGSGGRGIGGPKCGATGLVALCYNGQLVVANVGDARAVLVTSDGEAQQLSIDHVPDNEEERYRIELRNPNKKMPLVRFVGATWRVGGLLALSRAFGDAYMKASGDFEGYGTANDDYGSGFGVIAEPHVAQLPIPQTSGKTGRSPVLVLSSDGLYANEERGGGGGLTNDRVAEMVASLAPAPDAAALASLAQRLAEEAVEKGTTDDVTVMCIRLA
jgi:protein phosphatase 1L